MTETAVADDDTVEGTESSPLQKTSLTYYTNNTGSATAKLYKPSRAGRGGSGIV